MRLQTLPKPLSLFVPIQRMEDSKDGLIVEGFSFVNPKVGDGYNLTRAAMVAASEDYQQWGCVREMHDNKKAAGTSLELEWQERGAFHRALIVDSEAIKKVKTGVYKGFSVGVSPTVVRGEDVLSCKWNEISLVDRPADPDATFSIARADNPTDGPISVQVYEPTEELPGEAVQRSDAQFAAKVGAEVQRLLNTGEYITRAAMTEALAAVQTVAPELPADIVRRADYDVLVERINTIERSPAVVNLPLLPGGDRTVNNPADKSGANTPEVAAGMLELTRLDGEIEIAKAKHESDTVLALVTRRSAVKIGLRASGYDA